MKDTPLREITTNRCFDKVVASRGMHASYMKILQSLFSYSQTLRTRFCFILLFFRVAISVIFNSILFNKNICLNYSDSGRSDENAVKRYYIDVERYDWVKAADRLAGVETIFHRNRERKIRKLFVDYGMTGRILDMGCGTGLILRNLPVGSIGLDINPWNLEMVKSHIPNAEVLHADCEDLPVEEETVATVVCTEVLEHVPHPEKVLSEIHRVLIPGGRLVGSVPAKSIFWLFRVLSSTCPRSEPFHHCYVSEQVIEMLRGFSSLLLEQSVLRLNFVFVCEKKHAATPAEKKLDA